MKRKEEKIELTKEQKEKAIARIKEYMETEYEIKMGNLRSEFLLDFIAENIGVFYYNRGLADAIQFMSEKVEDMYVLMKDEE